MGQSVFPVPVFFPRVNTPAIVQAVPNSASYVTLVSVTGSSGYLTSVNSASGTASGGIQYAEITTDDVLRITDVIIGVFAAAVHSGSGLTGPFYFGNSLLVRGRNFAANANPRHIVGYILGSPLKNQVNESKEIEKTTENEYHYVIEKWITEAGKEVTIKTLRDTIPLVKEEKQ